MIQVKRSNGQNYADNVIDSLLYFDQSQTWTIVGTGTAVLDNTVVFSGISSLKLDNTDPTVDLVASNSVQSTVIEVGGDYEFSCYCRKDDALQVYTAQVEIFKNAVLLDTQTISLGGDDSDEYENKDYNAEWVRFHSDQYYSLLKSDVITFRLTLDGIPGYVGANTSFWFGGMMLNIADRVNFMPPAYVPPKNLKNELFGVYDYNDNTTSTTPISLSPSTWTALTNDGLGSFTNKVYALTNVSDVYDTSSGLFDFSGLELGDKIDIRFVGNITTTGANQTCLLRLKAAIGTGSEYTIPFNVTNEFKTAGLHDLSATSFITMLNTDTLNNGARFEIFSDASANIEVVGWQCVVSKRLV